LKFSLQPKGIGFDPFINFFKKKLPLRSNFPKKKKLSANPKQVPHEVIKIL
jgi:hypothetical protein